jgi:hypothetical protein
MVCSFLSVSPQYSLGQGGRFFSVIPNLLEDEEGGLLSTELQNSGGNSYCSLCAIFENCVKDVRFLNANFDPSGAQYQCYREKPLMALNYPQPCH